MNMLGGLLSVRFKAAERALKAGRLDDALRMADEPDIAGHARGGRLLADLAKAFIERAREHYRAERFTEALLDLGRAERCGGCEKSIAELRGQVTVVAREVARQDADRKRRLEQARRYIAGGSLAAGRQLLQSADGDDGELAEIRRDIEKRERRAADLVAQADGLFRQQRTEAAVEHLLRALQLDAHDEQAMKLESHICAQAVKEARAAFEAGNLRRARAELAALRTLGQHDDARAEMADCLRCAEEAAGALQAGSFDDARQRVRRLQNLAPKVSWVRQAVAELDRLDTALLALRSGPLGDAVAAAAAKGMAPLTETVVLPRPQVAPTLPVESALPQAMLLLVDGGGSYLLHRGDRVSIGRAAAADPADIPVFSDLSVRHTDLLRVEDDYFLMGPNEVEVAGRRTRQQLLRDGDRVVLARRAKFTLRIPNRRSPSARVDLSDSTKLPNDVRRVVLFKQTAMIGRGSDCHITCHAARSNLVLFERGGALFVRPQGQRGGEEIAIELGQPVEFEGASFVIQLWSAGPAGAPRIA
jgi:hypothetical protein